MGHNTAMFTELKIPAGRRPLSATEARIVAVVGALITVLILAAVFEEFSAPRSSMAFMLLFWVPMLVLHELGHAVAARLLGWQVREVVIGFGRDLWQWQCGETRIRIKLAPLEGYVLPAPADAHGIRLKSLLIYAAGPGAELLLLAALLLLFGRDFVFGDAASVGQVAVQSLAVVILLGAGFNLLPFRSEGAVSDGLGILSSPFMSDAAIELRLLTVELREIRERLERGAAGAALAAVAAGLQRFPHNLALRLLRAEALSADGHRDAARSYVREQLDRPPPGAAERRAWLRQQARLELDADEPSWLVLDLALQKLLADSPAAPDLLALKGASLVLRGRYDAGGELLAEAWRRNDGSAEDADMLAYLAIAASRKGEFAAAEHFRSSFAALNRCSRLAARVAQLSTPQPRNASTA